MKKRRYIWARFILWCLIVADGTLLFMQGINDHMRTWSDLFWAILGVVLIVVYVRKVQSTWKELEES